MADDVSTLGIKIDSRDVTKARENLDKLTASADNAESSTQELGVTSERSGKKVKDLGTTSKKTGEQVTSSFNEATKSTSRYSTATKTAFTSSKNMRFATTNLSYQLQDVAVQAQMGTNAFIILAQQGPQIASIFGPGGAVIGALIAVAGGIGAFITKMNETEGAIESLSKKYLEFTTKTEELAASKLAVNELLKKESELLYQISVIEADAKYKKINEELNRLAGSIAKSNAAKSQYIMTSQQAAMLAELEKQITEDHVKATRELAIVRERLANARESTGEGKEEKERLDNVKALIESLERRKISYEQSTEALALYDLTQAKANETEKGIILALAAEIDLLEAKKEQKRKEEAEAKKALATREREIKLAQQYLDTLNPVDAKTRKVGEAKKLLTKYQKELGLSSEKLNKALKDLDKSLLVDNKAIKTLESTVKSFLATTKTEAEKLGDLRDTFSKALDMKGLSESLKNNLLTAIDEIDNRTKKLSFNNFIGSSKSAISSIQSMQQQGSKSYRAMAVAMDALNVASAVQAVLTQGSGDPYTAFARMAAMAAAVSSLGVSIGSFNGGGGGSGSAESVQKTQGTGTVFGDSTQKSESILRALEITADATSEIVNINRGMLSALTGLKIGIEQTAGTLVGNIKLPNIASIKRDQIQGALFDDIGIDLGNFIDDIATSIENAFFGGKQSVIDSGVQIVGGSLGEILNETLVQSYARIRTEGGWFHSDKSRTEIDALGKDISDQFGFVFQSIFETVGKSGASLGLDVSGLENFMLDTIKISTQGLSGEGSVEALTSEFSRIFDVISEGLLPGISDLANLGEGAGETLVRLATEFSLVGEAVNTLGFTLSDTQQILVSADGLFKNTNLTLMEVAVSQQALIRASSDLIEKTGGIEKFSSALLGFERNFLSAEEQLEVNTRRLTEALGMLPLPETREGFLALLQAQDALTESGRNNIATLLGLQDVADDYYSTLESNAAQALREAERVAAEEARLVEEAAKAAEKAAKEAIDRTRQYLEDFLSSAVERSNTALDSLRQSIENERSQLESSLASSINERKSAFEKEKIALKQSAQERLAQVKAAQSAEINRIKAVESVRADANKQALSAAKDGLKAISSELSGITSALESLQGLGVSQEVTRQKALAFLTKALNTGDLSGTGGAAKIAANIQAQEFRTAQDFNRQIAATKNVLSDLESSGMRQQSAAELTIERIESQTEAIKATSQQRIDAAKARSDAAIAVEKLNSDLMLVAAEDRLERELTLLEENHQSEVDKLEALVTDAENQLNALRGIETGVYSVEEALQRVNESIRAEIAARARMENFLSFYPSDSISENDILPEFRTGSTVRAPSQILPQNMPVTQSQLNDVLASDTKGAELMEMMYNTVKDGLFRISLNTRNMDKRFDVWDADGLPETRTV